ncbi:MAG: TolC family protein [Myxococcota bacterium]|nr:TolC family protein [Myxococcota bacterium]
MIGSAGGRLVPGGPTVVALAAAILLGLPAAPSAQPVDPGPPAPEPPVPTGLPAPTPGPAVTLEEAFDLARARHPQIRSVRMELEKADAMLRQAWGALLPRVSGQIMYTLNDQETVVNFADSLPPGMLPPDLDIEPTVVRRQHIVQSQIQVAAPLFNMPILSAIDMARLAGSMAALGEREAERQLLLGAATAYYGCLAAREIIDLYADAFSSAAERLRAARARLAAGAGILIDVARAELDMETARLDHQAALLAYDNAREALATLLVMDEMPAPLPPDDPDALPAPDDDLVAGAIERRADVEMRRRRIDLAHEQLGSAWASFFPSLSLVWQLNTELTEPPAFGGRRNAWALVFLLSIPIYDQPRYGLLDQRRAEIRQAEIDLEAAELAVRNEIRSAAREYESALTSIETAGRQVALAREALRLAEAGKFAGAATSLDVDDARQRVNAATINLTVQRYRSRMTLVRLLFLAGLRP